MLGVLFDSAKIIAVRLRLHFVVQLASESHKSKEQTVIHHFPWSGQLCVCVCVKRYPSEKTSICWVLDTGVPIKVMANLVMKTCYPLLRIWMIWEILKKAHVAFFCRMTLYNDMTLTSSENDKKALIKFYTMSNWATLQVLWSHMILHVRDR